MKDWMVLVMIIFTILIAGVSGFFFGKTKCETEVVSVPVIWQDPVLINRIDSFEVVDKVHLYYIDSLKKQLSILNEKHEININIIDTLPAPVIYQRIADYYSRK